MKLLDKNFPWRASIQIVPRVHPLQLILKQSTLGHGSITRISFRAIEMHISRLRGIQSAAGREENNCHISLCGYLVKYSEYFSKSAVSVAMKHPGPSIEEIKIDYLK